MFISTSKKQSGGARKLQVGQLHLSPLEDEKAAKSGKHCQALGQEGDRSSQHEFAKGKSCLINFCNENTGLVGEGRALDIVYLDFSKAFNAI